MEYCVLNIPHFAAGHVKQPLLLSQVGHKCVDHRLFSQKIVYQIFHSFTHPFTFKAYILPFSSDTRHSVYAGYLYERISAFSGVREIR